MLKVRICVRTKNEPFLTNSVLGVQRTPFSAGRHRGWPRPTRSGFEIRQLFEKRFKDNPKNGKNGYSFSCLISDPDSVYKEKLKRNEIRHKNEIAVDSFFRFGSNRSAVSARFVLLSRSIEVPRGSPLYLGHERRCRGSGR